MYYRRRAYDRRRVAIVAAVAAAGVLLTEAPLTDQLAPPEPSASGASVGLSCLTDAQTGYTTCSPPTNAVVTLDPRTGKIISIVRSVPDTRVITRVDPSTGLIIYVAVDTPATVDDPAGMTIDSPAGDW